MTGDLRLGVTLGIVGLLGLADLWIGVRPGLAPVDADAMAEAAAEARAQRAPGTIFLHSPLFGVPELSALGDLPARPDLPAPAARAGRAVVVIDRDEVPLEGLGRPEEVSFPGPGVAVRVYPPSGQASGRVPVFDLRDGLAPGTLHIERPPGRVVSECTRPRREGGFACPGQPEWLYAAPRRLQVGGQAADCVWAHPTTGGAVVFELPAFAPPPEGRRLELELGAALADSAVRGTPGGASVTTAVVQGGRRLGAVTRSNARGWARRAFRVEPGAPLRLEVTTPRDGQRHHCLDVRVLEVEP